MDDNVLLKRENFETLLRRANAAVSDPKSVTISRVEYDALTQVPFLRNTLLNKGVANSDATIDVWIDEGNQSQHLPEPGHGLNSEGIRETNGEIESELVNRPNPYSFKSFSSVESSGLPYKVLPPAGTTYESLSSSESSPRLEPEPFFPSHPWSGGKDTGSKKKGKGFSNEHLLTQRPSQRSDQAATGSWQPSLPQGLPQQDIVWKHTAHHSRKIPKKHTVLLSNIPPDATLRDITKNIQGGQLVDIWMRKSHRKVEVTFLEGAWDFISHYKNKGLYISSWKVDVEWCQRQYDIRERVKENAAKGASREFVIRHGAEKLTEAQIRDHMDHIHKLFIISVEIVGEDIYVETNSMNNTYFAVNCMRSREAYKGLRIEQSLDRCNVPLPEKAPLEEIPNWRQGPQRPAQQPPTNKFGMLQMDGADDDEESESDDTSSKNSGIDLNPRSRATTVVE
ncbi:MAG: hypothetical protein M1831_004997 [Alyxoria varia]|nr:MAG: hypothetical protein M1831_004997 [Alyxoria varia]